MITSLRLQYTGVISTYRKENKWGRTFSLDVNGSIPLSIENIRKFATDVLDSTRHYAYEYKEVEDIKYLTSETVTIYIEQSYVHYDESLNNSSKVDYRGIVFNTKCTLKQLDVDKRDILINELSEKLIELCIPSV